MISRSIAEAAVTQFLSASPGLISLCLFGSRARGDAREDSDYDWYLVVDESLQTLPRSAMDRLVPFLPVQRHLKKITSTSHNLVIRSLSQAQRFETLHASMARDGIILFDTGFLRNLLNEHRDAYATGRLKFEPIKSGGEFIIYDKIAGSFSKSPNRP